MDDIGDTLGELERRLREIEAELHGASAEASRAAAARAPSAGHGPAPGPVPPAYDDLLRFRDELHRATDALHRAYDDLLGGGGAGRRQAVLFHGAVTVEAHPVEDARTLHALERALAHVPGSAGARATSLHDRRGTLNVHLTHPITLVAELEAASEIAFAVDAAEPPRLAITVTG